MVIGARKDEDIERDCTGNDAFRSRGPPENNSGPGTKVDVRPQKAQSSGGGASASGNAVAPSGPSRQEHLYKVLVIGELGTGKTSIIKRYVHQFFSNYYRATIGVDFALKVLNWEGGGVVRLQLWDIAGQERFGNMTRVYYKEAVGAFLVFDLTKASSFEAVAKWKADLDAKVQLPDGRPIPCVLLANKCDLGGEAHFNNQGKMDEYVQEKGFAGWFKTSAKDNINIDEAATFLVSQIMVNEQGSSGSLEADQGRISIDGKASSSSKSSSCSSC